MSMKFEKHIFICTNQRTASDRKSCGESTGMELVKQFKKLIKDNHLNVSVRAQRAGCIDACDFGPSIVVYPEGIFYGGVTTDDVLEIFNDHIRNNSPVERLRIKFIK